MAIDPTKPVPTDSATVQSLQSTTEASAKAAMRAPVEAAWMGARGSFIDNVLQGLGSILGGALSIGGNLLQSVVSGVVSFVDGFVGALRNLFGGAGGGGTDPEGNPLPPPEPLWVPVQLALEEVLAPKFDTIDQALEDSAGYGTEIEELNTELGTLLSDSPDSKLWQIQEKINDIAQQRDDAQDDAIRAIEETLKLQSKSIPREIFVPRNQPMENEHWTIQFRSGSANGWTAVAKPGWVGQFSWQSVYYPTSGDAAPVLEGYEVGTTTTRTWNLTAFQRHQSILRYYVQDGVPEFENLVHAPQTLSPGVWTTIHTFDVSETTTHSLYWRVGWDAANYLDQYGISILRERGGQTHIITGGQLRNKVGPVFGEGYNTITATIPSEPLQAGDRLLFRACATGSNSTNRKIRNSWSRVGWVRPAV